MVEGGDYETGPAVREGAGISVADDYAGNVAAWAAAECESESATAAEC